MTYPTLNSENHDGAVALSVVEIRSPTECDVEDLLSSDKIKFRESVSKAANLVLVPDCVLDCVDNPVEYPKGTGCDRREKQVESPSKIKLQQKEKPTQVRSQGVSSLGLPQRIAAFTLVICWLLPGFNGEMMMKTVGEEFRYPIKCPSTSSCDVLFSGETEGRQEKVYDGTDRRGFRGYDVDDRENLVFRVTQASAGNYCVDVGGNECWHTFELIVVLSDPVCNASMNPAIDGTVESYDLWAWCTVTYVGKGVPQMKWTIDGTRHVTPNAQTVNTIGAVSTFTSRFNKQVSSSRNSMMVIFRIIFELRELPEHARHGPTLSYAFTWKHTVNVSSAERLKSGATALNFSTGLAAVIICVLGYFIWQ